MSSPATRKHITEASTAEIAEQIGQGNMELLHRYFDFSSPQPAEGVAELIDQLKRAHAMSVSDPADPARKTLYSRAAAALSAAQSPTPQTAIAALEDAAYYLFDGDGDAVLAVSLAEVQRVLALVREAEGKK